MGRIATTILLSMVFLIQSLSGCFGDDQQTTDYDGPIDLIVYYAVTNGTIQKSVNNGNNGPTTGVEINFDLATQPRVQGLSSPFSLTQMTVLRRLNKMLERVGPRLITSI